VLTRTSTLAYLSTVTVAPVTSTIRGVPSQVVLNEEDDMKSPGAVNLHNAVTVSQQSISTTFRKNRSPVQRRTDERSVCRPALLFRMWFEI